MTDPERPEWDLKLRRLDAVTGNPVATAAEIDEETAEIARGRFWIPFTVFAGVIVAVVSIAPRLFG